MYSYSKMIEISISLDREKHKLPETSQKILDQLRRKLNIRSPRIKKPASFIKKFAKPILNIHPSLLPKYKGLNTHERAIKNKDKYAGVSIHKVTKKLDSGKIILQKKVRILKSDNAISLKKRVIKVEHKVYPKAIVKFFSNL